MTRSYGLMFGIAATLMAPLLATAQSQVTNGVIEVAVTDASGAVVTEAAVEILNKDTGFKRSLLTNSAGRGTAPLLPLGSYEISVMKPGFAVVKVDNVLLQIGERRSIDVSMKVSTVSETVEVLGSQVPIVETARVNSSARLDDRAVHNLPTLSRSFQTFILLSPGALQVSRTGSEANFSVGGQKGIHTGFTVDGADYSNSFFGGQIGGDRPPFTVSLEAVKEFVVLSNGFNAEFGRSGGGMLNAVTKSGTNQYHGNAFWYFQDKKFVKDDYFDRPPRGRRQQFGGTIGGPIKKDKLFFFATTDNQRRNTPINLAFNGQSTLTEAAASSDPARREAAEVFLSRQGQILAGDDVKSLLGKVDWNINTMNTLSARYNWARNDQNNGVYGLLPQQARSQENFGKEHISADSFNIQLATVFSSKALNEFRYNANREDRPRLDYIGSGDTEVNGVFGGAEVNITPIGRIGKPGFLPIGSLEWRHQFTNNFSYYFGKHDLKFGTDNSIISFDNLFRGNARGLYTFFTFDSFVAKQPDQYTQFFGSGQVVTHPKYTALFAQDSYKAKPGLTINYGVRWEGQINPIGDLPNRDFLQGTEKIPNDLGMLSPRVGIAWDPKNNGKNVIRLFGAYFYAPSPTLIWANVIRQNGDVSNGVNYFADRTAPQNLPAFNFPFAGPYPTPYATFPGAVAVQSGTLPNGNVNIADPAFHNPRITRTNVSYERAIMRDLTLTTTYDYSFTTGNQRRKDLNLFPGTVDPITGRTIYNRATRPYPFAATVISREATSSARYQALTVAANKRFSRNFQAQAFYTYGNNKTDDDNENNCCGNEGLDQYNWRLDWSRSRLDIRHNFVMNGVFALPFGFEVSPTIRAQSGRPFNGTTGSDSPTATALTAAALENFRNYIGKPGAVVFGGGNGDTTTTDRAVVDGVMLPRNGFEQPKYFRTDMRVGKSVNFSETMQLKITVDMFNLFNNANLYTTNTQISSPSFGVLNNADEPFGIQTGLRFSW